MEISLRQLLLGRNGRSQMLTGLRGVGKTVLLNEFEHLAEARGFFHEHIEVADDGFLAPALVAAFRRVLLTMDAKRRVGERIRRALGILKAFSLHLPGGVEVNIDVDAVSGLADSGDLASDLAALFVEMGEVARDHAMGVLVTIDELHYVHPPTLTALLVGLHRAVQLRLPIMVASAGLPSLARLTRDAKTYAEQIFTFSRIGSLSTDLAIGVLVTPASAEGVQWAPAALERVVTLTQCYPYFLQEFGKAAWDVANGPDCITAQDVERSVPVALAALDDGFFRLKMARTTDTERRYLRAMADLGPGPVRSAEVAALLGKRTNAFAPTRDVLIKRAMCYSPRWGELEFTVPLFDQFMRRWLPELPTFKRE